MDRLVQITNKDDIFPEYRGTPIGDLIEYHNLNKSFKDYERAELLIGMCMDHRKSLNIQLRYCFGK